MVEDTLKIDNIGILLLKSCQLLKSCLEKGRMLTDDDRLRTKAGSQKYYLVPYDVVSIIYLNDFIKF